MGTQESKTAAYAARYMPRYAACYAPVCQRAGGSHQPPPTGNLHDALFSLREESTRSSFDVNRRPRQRVSA
ncbi:unnamed protein product [Lampetra fluviatilis]